VAKKKKNSDYNYTQRRKQEAYLERKKQLEKKAVTEKRVGFVIGILAFLATTVTAFMNLSNPNKVTNILCYTFMTLAMFLFYDHFKEANPKFSKVSLFIGVFSGAFLLFLVADYMGLNLKFF